MQEQSRHPERLNYLHLYATVQREPRGPGEVKGETEQP
jgi:hypothetical protein